MLGRGFWLGEELKLVSNTYNPVENQFEPAVFSPMVAILDLFYLNPKVNPTVAKLL